jgi:hypothetical protein
MTFLQYVAERLLGPCVRRGAPGESWWRCPLHGDETPSFHTLPTKRDEREYWHCFSCNSGGDVYQLMRCLRRLGHPECWGNWDPHHKVKVAAWEAEWRRSLNDSTRGNKLPAPPAQYSPLVDNVEVDPLTAGLGYSTDPFDVEAAYRDATPRQAESLALAFVCARDAGVDLAALARYAYQQELEWVRWLRDMDKLHLSECNDPNCEARVCRIARESLNGTH